MKVKMYELVTYLKDRAYHDAPQLATMVSVLMNSSTIEKSSLYRIMPLEGREIEDYLDLLIRSNYVTVDRRNLIHTDGLELLMSRAQTYYFSLSEDMPIPFF